MASKNVCVLCGAQVDCYLITPKRRGSNNNSIASRKTEVFLAHAMYS